jgi:glycosyltransferase involved in cell wall biosynthesis
MQITIYSPDRHFIYDGATPDDKGVGGGLTARVRIAAALAARGNDVSVICNCPFQSRFDGVSYVPLDSLRKIETEVLIAHSSGDKFDIYALLDIPVKARLKVVAISGIGLPKGTVEFAPRAVYACSNFVRTEVARHFPFIPLQEIFVTYYGVNSWNWPNLFSPRRDPQRLIYSSHPSKGLEASRELLRQLRTRDPRFTLHAFGGNQLWGGIGDPPPSEPGMFDGGLINQRNLAGEYKRSAFLLQLQTRPEPFGITVVEAMAAGCLVIASPVGAFPEFVKHGENGFLIEGDPADALTIGRAAELILDVSKNPKLAYKIRQRASSTPFTWRTIARVWQSHLEWLIDGKKAQPLQADRARCAECDGVSLMLADGYHCTSCGYFGRERRASPAMC